MSALPPIPPITTVPVKTPTQSKTIWLTLIGFGLWLGMAATLMSAPGWQWDKPHLLTLIPATLGFIKEFIQTLVRLMAPDLLSGIGLFDKGTPGGNG